MSERKDVNGMDLDDALELGRIVARATGRVVVVSAPETGEHAAMRFQIWPDGECRMHGVLGKRAVSA